MLQKAGVGFFYYHSNHQGSITQLTDSSGTVANSYVYDSYGRRLNVVESVIQPFSYTGREYDEESGLYFYRARYFDANTGRFFSEDPIGLKALDQNLYNYVFNNPLNLIDPNGESAIVAAAIIIGASIAVAASIPIFAKVCLENCLAQKENESNSKPKVPPNLPGGNPSCPPDNPDPPEDDPMQPRKDNLNLNDCLQRCKPGLDLLFIALDPFSTLGTTVGTVAGGGGAIGN